MRASQELRHLDRWTFKPPGYLIVIPLLMIFSFILGAFWGQTVPRTLFTKPMATIRMMRTFPIHSSVLPANTSVAAEQFQEFRWRTDPAKIVDYEAVILNEEEVILCRVRISHRGTGETLLVNPDWITPSNPTYK